MARSSIKNYRPAKARSEGSFYSPEDIDSVAQAGGHLPKGRLEQARASKDGSKLVARNMDRRKALAEQLELAAQNWSTRQERANKPTPAQLAKQLGKIEKAADRVLAALGLPPDKSSSSIVAETDYDILAGVPDALRFGALQAFAALDIEEVSGPSDASAERLLRDVVLDIYRLRDWARAATVRNERKRKVPLAQRHRGDKPLDMWFGDLIGIYFETFNAVPATSVGAPNTPIAGEPTGPMIRFLNASLSPVLGIDTPSDEAIRERVRKLLLRKQKPKAKKT